jgi:hypothetical protein
MTISIHRKHVEERIHNTNAAVLIRPLRTHHSPLTRDERRMMIRRKRERERDRDVNLSSLIGWGPIILMAAKRQIVVSCQRQRTYGPS